MVPVVCAAAGEGHARAAGRDRDAQDPLEREFHGQLLFNFQT
jgi:hypothetical protein